jgi:hypothetical protein
MKSIKILTFSFILSCVLLSPFVLVNAQTPGTTTSDPSPGTTTTDPTPGTTTTDPTPGTTTSNPTQSSPIRLVNPLQTTQTLPQLVEGILRVVLTIGVPLVALAIVYAGFKFVAAQGRPEKLQEARRTLLYVVVGAGILLAAYVIAEAIVETVNAIRGGN